MIKPWLYSILGLAGFLVGSYVLLTYGLPLVLPFAVALVVAEFIDPLVGSLTWKGKVPRWMAVLFVMVILIGLIMTAVTVAIGKLVQELNTVYTQLPYIYSVVKEMASQFAIQFGAFHAALPQSIQGILMDNLKTMQDGLSKYLQAALPTLGAISSLPVFLANVLIALIALFFISRDRKVINRFLLSLFPGEWRPKIRKVKDDVWSSAIGWAKAQAILIFLTMVQTIIGLSLIGANYSVLMGIVVGVADMLPVLGPASVYLPWIAYCLLFGNTVFGLKLLVLYAIVASIRQVLEAKMVGDQIGLHPLAILLSIYLGVQFFGGLGFVAGPLLAILLKAMIRSDLLPIFKESTDPLNPPS